MMFDDLVDCPLRGNGAWEAMHWKQVFTIAKVPCVLFDVWEEQDGWRLLLSKGQTGWLVGRSACLYCAMPNDHTSTANSLRGVVCDARQDKRMSLKVVGRSVGGCSYSRLHFPSLRSPFKIELRAKVPLVGEDWTDGLSLPLFYVC